MNLLVILKVILCASYSEFFVDFIITTIPPKYHKNRGNDKKKKNLKKIITLLRKLWKVKKIRFIFLYKLFLTKP